MIGPGDLDIDIFQGANFVLPLELTDDNDDPVSLSGATVRGKVKNDLDDVAAIFSFTGTVTDGPNGECELTLTAAQTAAWVAPANEAKKLKATKYRWDMEVEFSDGFVQRVLQGVCLVWPEVTK